MSLLKLPTRPPSRGNVSSSIVNHNPKAEDCYYYYYSKCSKGDKCKFRHCSAALGSEEVCQLWVNGDCSRDVCAFRHTVLRHKRSNIVCYWESQPTGCLKPHCPFLHSKLHLKVPGPLTRLTEFKEAAKLAKVKVKTLDELRHQSSPTAINGSTVTPPPAITSTSPTSVNVVTTLPALTTTSQETAADKQVTSPTKIHIKPTTFASMLQASTATFAGVSSQYSVYSPFYQAHLNSRLFGAGAKSHGYNKVWKPDGSNKSTPQQESSHTEGNPVFIGTRQAKDSTQSSHSIVPSKHKAQDSKTFQPATSTVHDSVSTTSEFNAVHASEPEMVGEGVGVYSNKSTPTMSSPVTTSTPARVVRASADDTKSSQPRLTLKQRLGTIAQPGALQRERRAMRFGQVTEDFQVKSLDEIRAEKKRKAVQVAEAIDDIPPPETNVSSKPSQPITIELFKPPSPKKKKIVIIRRKLSASCEQHSSSSTTQAADSSVSTREGSSGAVRRIMIRRVKPVSQIESTVAQPTPDLTCIDRSKPLEELVASGEASKVGGQDEEEVPTAAVQGEVRRKSVAEVKAEIQRELAQIEASSKDVDDELQQLDDLEEGEEADSLLASRTDDDLILEMEEFI